MRFVAFFGLFVSLAVAQTCTWPGHCLGDPCVTLNDCDQTWVCTNGVCSVSGSTTSKPTARPTLPTGRPTVRPTARPTTGLPTARAILTSAPTRLPSVRPTTSKPSTSKPSTRPTSKPTSRPTASAGTALKAALTTFESYPSCCEGSLNYNPACSTAADPECLNEDAMVECARECACYSGCDYQGWFANGVHMDFPQVKSSNLVAFFDRAQGGLPEAAAMDIWRRNYANRTIRVTSIVAGRSTPVVFDAQIVDTCGDWDCGGCCIRNTNAVPGADYLVDVEEQTRLRFFGDATLPSSATFQILPPAGR